MSTHLSNVPTPKEGWVEELTKAEAAAKKRRTAKAQFRLATAACKMRQWKKAKTASNLALAFDPSDAEKKILVEYVKISSKELETTIRTDEESVKFLRQTMCQFGKRNVRCIKSDSIAPRWPSYTILQYAVATGDVSLLEEAVAAGAALDTPAAEPELKDTYYEVSALLLACSLLATSDILRRTLPTRHIDNSICACAVRLVCLGADCQVKLHAPVCVDTPLWLNLKDEGKTAFELAKLSCRLDLVEAMESMQNRDNAIRLTRCRCGSRLPWRECHGAPIPGQSPLFRNSPDGHVLWRYSPTAHCHCQLTKKEHYQCCWFSPDPAYLLDATTQIVFRSLGADGHTRTAAVSANSVGTQEDQIVVAQEEVLANRAAEIRQVGLGRLCDRNGRRCTVKDWDQEVFAGVMERIAPHEAGVWALCFMWDDLHWPLALSVLLRRTQEWNMALEEYCNDRGLRGLERDAVTKKHTANPCAPCANPLCDGFETEPKEFFPCARCKCVAYCSPQCQEQDWKPNHRARCNET